MAVEEIEDGGGVIAEDEALLLEEHEAAEPARSRRCSSRNGVTAI